MVIGIFVLEYLNKDILKYSAVNGIFSASATLIVGLIAILIYFKQKQDKKRDAARIIVQEIRRAEDLISRYIEHRNFSFTKKI